MENDEKLLKTKTLVEVDKSTSLPVVENGSGILEEGKIDTSGCDDININIPLKELSPRKNISDRQADAKECSADDFTVETGAQGSIVEEREPGPAEKTDVIAVQSLVGDDRLTQNPECCDNDSSKIVGNHGCEEKHLKLEADERSNSEVKSLADGNKGDPRKKGDNSLDGISQRTRGKSLNCKKEESKDMGIAENGSEVDEGDHESGFATGDFVWGKIKSHPWWPGRIFDSSNASEFALKHKHEGWLLVAYHGDGTFAWCNPSQLKPFGENFEEMSKQSSSKTFVKAVEEAVNEFGRLVELHWTCSCSRKESESSLPLVVNAGIKEGVPLPKDGVKKLPFQFEPEEMLADIRLLARFVSAANTLELAVLKSWLQAFYRAKGYSLPMYSEPLGVEGLEDKDGVSRKRLTRGPVDDDSYIRPGDAQTQNGPETPFGESHKMKKEKSIAELLGKDTDITSKSGKKKRKIEVRTEDKHESNADETVTKKEKEKQGELVSKSGRRLRSMIVDQNQSDAADNTMVNRSSTRKKEGSARSTTVAEKIAAKERKMSVRVRVDKDLIEEEGHERMSPRERKKSKYLSPPYTSSLHKQQRNDGLEFSDVARMGERMAKVAGKIVGSPPLAKCSAETYQKSSKGLVSTHERLDRPLSLKADGSSNNLLSEIRTAAIRPLYPRNDQSIETIRDFVSSYRSSNYKNGSNYNSSDKKLVPDQRKRKRNSSSIKHGSDEKFVSQVQQPQSEPKTIGRRSATKEKKGKSDSKADHGVSSKAKKNVNVQTTKEKKGKFESKDDREVSSSKAKKNVNVENEKMKMKKKNKKKNKSSETETQEEGKLFNNHPSGAGESENEPLAVVFIKQKLEEMTSMLARTDGGKMSEEMKSNLEKEVKELLQKVKMMTAASSSS